MFGKKNTKVVNTYDEKMRAYFDDTRSAKACVINAVQKAYIKKQALSVWSEDAADYKSTFEELQTAQKSVQCAVSHYDTVKVEMINYYRTNNEKCGFNWAVDTFPNSHDLIDFTIKDLFR